MPAGGPGEGRANINRNEEHKQQNQPRTEAPAVGQGGILAGLGGAPRSTLQSAVRLSPADRPSWGWGVQRAWGAISVRGRAHAH